MEIQRLRHHHLMFYKEMPAESASRPPGGFWCLNDKMIKELISFAKCEIEKKLISVLK
jgi:hypothetical protein